MLELTVTPNFESLKRSCSPYDDMRRWFEENIDLYPRLNGVVIAGTRVKLLINNCEVSSDKSTLLQRITVEYHIPIGQITYATFTAETGSPSQYSVPECFKSSFTSYLDLREWPPFVAALIYPVMRMENENTEYYELIIRLWLMHFPKFPLMHVFDMKASGLLPATREGFCSFVMNYGKSLEDNGLLPIDIVD